jgi:hypothetical protein
MRAAYGVPVSTPLALPAVVRSDATGNGTRSCGVVRPTSSIQALMEVVTYSLLALALMKIFAAGGLQHFGDGLDGSSPRP